MSRIVTSHYRYKRPPRKRTKAVALEGPAVVTIRDKKAALTAFSADPPKSQQATGMATNSGASPVTPVNNVPQPAIVTARKPRARGGNRRLLAELPNTDEEHQRRGDQADAMMQEFKRQIAEKVRK